MSQSIRSVLETLVGPGTLLPEAEVGRWRTGPGEGGVPAAALAPSNEEETAQILGRAGEEGWTVQPAGRGGWLAGAGPSNVQLVVSTERMRAMRVYEPADLTFTAGAGLSLAGLREETDPHRQWLPLDPPGGLEGTLGAAVSTGIGGPLRHLYGSARDHVLGLTLVSGQGEVLRWGGRVVKNVAGFDLTKLTIGSWGSLGVVTSVSARLFPVPESDVTLVFRGPDASELLPAARAMALSPMPLATVELLDPFEVVEEGLGGVEGRKSGAALVLRLLGSGVQVAEMETRARSELSFGPGLVERFTGSESESLHRVLNAWEGGADLVLRLALLPSQLGSLVREAENLRELTGPASSPSAQVHQSAHVGSGILRIAVRNMPTGEEASASWGPALLDLRRRLEERGGTLNLSWGPEALMRAVGAWGSAGLETELMAGLKAQFDPAGILCPGRLGL